LGTYHWKNAVDCWTWRNLVLDLESKLNLELELELGLDEWPSGMQHPLLIQHVVGSPRFDSRNMPQWTRHLRFNLRDISVFIILRKATCGVLMYIFCWWLSLLFLKRLDGALTTRTSNALQGHLAMLRWSHLSGSSRGWVWVVSGALTPASHGKGVLVLALFSIMLSNRPLADIATACCAGRRYHAELTSTPSASTCVPI